MTSANRWQVDVDGETTTAVYQPANNVTRPDAPVFVLAHGAGGNLDDRAMKATAASLVERGFPVVRYNFLYREKGSGRPDPMPRLERTVEAVVAHVRRELAPDRLVIGGRSMGGRASSMVAAKGFDCDGLLLLAYPLHPPGRFEQLRDAHLPDIAVPTLCINGTRDTFCRRDLMEEVLKRVGPRWKMHWIEGADHGFHVLKSSGRTDGEVQREIAELVAEWAG